MTPIAMKQRDFARVSLTEEREETGRETPWLLENGGFREADKLGKKASQRWVFEDGKFCFRNDATSQILPLGGGFKFSNYFLFSPLGEDEAILTTTFQMG